MAADKVVRGKNMGLLFRYQLANGQREVLVQHVGVSLFYFIFALFGCFKQSVVSPTQLRFHVSPDPLKSAHGCAGFFDVMHAVLVKDLFQIAAEAGSL